MHFEATIAITHHVRRVVVGNRVIRLKSSDVTNVNVMAKLQVYVLRRPLGRRHGRRGHHSRG